MKLFNHTFRPGLPKNGIKQNVLLPKRLHIAWLSALLLLIILLGSVVQAGAQNGSCTTPSFAAAVNYGAGNTPYFVTKGDFNGDGKLDLVTANFDSDNVSVLLGNGSGSFTAATNFGVGDEPFSVITADFNRDGKLDLVTANSSSDNISVLLGNGTGGFAAATNFRTGSVPRSITTGDFNGDGNLDLATANQSSGNISVLLGNGIGGFAAPANFNLGNAPVFIITNDFNGDGNLDLATANYITHSVSVLPGNGYGSFTAPVNFDVGYNPVSITPADFNEDGKLDLVTANQSSGNISVLLGNVTGGFSAATNYNVGTSPSSVVAGDFNGDGKIDIAIANLNSDNVSLLSGNGTGSFAAAINFFATDSPVSIVTDDFNGDGKTDIATANVGINKVSVLLNTCSGNCPATGFAAAGNYVAGTRPYFVTTGDFNDDGKLDIVAANGSSDNISVLLRNGTGGFAPAVNFAAGDLPNSITTGDFDRDGKLDIATANISSSNVSVLLGYGTGNFASADNYDVGIGPRSITTGDFNGDGKLDLATANQSTDNISVLLGNGFGGFAPAVNFATGDLPYSITTGDFNRDGKPDLATVNYNSGNVSVLLNNGTGGFVSATSFNVGSGPRSITTGDFNGDGKLDIATANQITNNVSVLLGNGTGGFATAVNYDAGIYPYFIITGDFNRDGKTDIVTTNINSNNVSMLLNNGMGGFASPASFNVSRNPESITTGDFNGDGKLDVATANSGSDNVSVLLNVCRLPKPTVTASGPTTFCAGNNVVLSVPAGFASYAWSSGATTRSITVTTSGSYTVIVTDASGISSFPSDPVTVTVNSLPDTPTVSITQPTCTTATGTIMITAPLETGNMYSINGNSYKSGTTFSGVGPGNYNVTVRNSSGCVSTATPVTINAQPATPAMPTVKVAQPACGDSTGAIFITAPTGSGLSYSINGITYQASNLFFYIAPGNYTVTVKNSSGCVSASVPVTINTASPIPATPVVSVVQPTCTAATGTITVNSPVDTGITYSIDGTNYGTGNVFNNAAPGNYNVTVRSSNGCVSAATPITINPQPTTTATPVVNVTQPACTIATGSITVNSPTGADITYSIGNTNYQTSNVFSNVAPGNYNVTAKSSSGCVSASAPVTINPQPATPGKPVVTPSGPTTFNQGGSVTLTAPAGFASYQWSNGATTRSITVNQSGTHTVRITNSSGCTSPASDPVTVTVTVPLSVSHLDGDNGQLTNNNIRPYLQLNNEGSTPVSYSSLTIRYWLTVEDFAPMTNLVIDYAQPGTNKVTMKYVKLPQPRAGAFGYIEYTFAASAGNLAANSNSGPIQSRAGKSNWTNFNEADDYSYKSSTSYTKNNKITLYQNGTLVWGTEPAAVTLVQSLKVYSQDKSNGTITNTISHYTKVNNEGNTPVSYRDITVRYWFTADGTQPLNYYLDYAELGNSNITSKFVRLSTPLNGADTYLELGFTATDSLYPISTTGNLQQRIAKSDWSNFNQGNDHSYKPGSTMSENIKMTVYVKGMLVYGTEPTAGAIARSSSTASVTQPAMVSVVKGTTETDEVLQGAAIVYPNPNRGRFSVQLHNSRATKADVQVLNAQGMVVSKKTVQAGGKSQTIPFSLNNPVAGTYLIKIVSEEGVQVLKMIVQP